MPPDLSGQFLTSGGTVSELSELSNLESEDDVHHIRSETTATALNSEAPAVSESEDNWADREATPRANENPETGRVGHETADINFDSYGKEADTDTAHGSTYSAADDDYEVEDAPSDAEATEAMEEDFVEEHFEEDDIRSTDMSEHEESSATCLDEEEPYAKSSATRSEIEQFNATFQNIGSRYRLIDKIGEGNGASWFSKAQV